MGPVEIKLDRGSDLPLGAQLAWHFRSLIARGELGPGAQLPGARALAASTGVNVNTVRSVYARLESEGVLTAEHGRGTFVSAGAARSPKVKELAREPVAGAGPGADVSERRALRADIAALELALARLEPLSTSELPPPSAAPSSAGRLLGADELRALRDELSMRAASLEDALRVHRQGIEERRSRAMNSTLDRAPGRRAKASPRVAVRWIPA
jgi:DNA-binding transcriptional regulator YhcF (GntR family)